jgi:CHAT domain-containing protein/Tfp pilus assembly protein PilF
VLCLLLAVAQTATAGEQSPDRLEPGKPIERQLSPGESHAFQIAAAADQLLQVAVEQCGINVVMTVVDPDGQQLAQEDRDKTTRGTMLLTFIADRSGTYRLKIHPAQKNVAPGRYAVNLVGSRSPSADDRALEEARRLLDQASKLTSKANYDAALPLSERALAIREKVLGANHLAVADALQAIAQLCEEKGDYAKAQSLVTRALSIRESALTPEDPSVAESIASLGVVFFSKGDYAQAESLLQRAKGILEKRLGPDHSSVAATIVSLGRVYVEKAQYGEAESAYSRALEIQERALGPNHLLVATTLGSLGALHYYLADYSIAESFYRRATLITQTELGADHPNVGKGLHNLAALLDRTGDYAQAEPLYHRAIEIWQRTLGPNHPLVAKALSNLADLYGKRADYARAEPLYRRALAIRENSLGANHPDLAWTLSHLGQLLAKKGDYAEAEALFRRALAIQEKGLGPDHPDVADSLRKLGGLYSRQQKYVQAEPLHQRAVAILEKALGPDHPDVAQALNNLADVRRKRGNYAQAEPVYRRALAIGERAVGPAHPDVAVSLDALAAIAAAKRDTPRALTYLSRYLEVSERNLTRNLPLGSERQKISYLQLFSRDMDDAITLHVRSAPRDSAALHLAFTMLLRRKGRALDAVADNIGMLRARANAEDQALFGQLSDARSQLATITLRGPKKDVASFHRRLGELEEKIDSLEAEMSGRSAQFRSQSRSITLEAVQSAIPKATALVEFVRYRSREVGAEGVDTGRYVAYVLSEQGPPRWVDLGDDADIDRALQAWQRSLRDPDRTDVTRLGRAVDQRVMRPVRALVGSARHLLISPDAGLNLVPFAALIDEHGRYLVERYTITYLTSGRDLLRLQVARDAKSPPVIVADPALGEPAVIGSTGRLDYSQVFFGPLPGVRAEVRALKELLREATFLTQAEATKSALQHLSGPRILHVATHGFFLEGDQHTAPANIKVAERDETRLAKWAVQVDNPMLRSGLALAGANQASSGTDDGILTAFEMAGLDLWGTKLVVLSACDTGLGEVKNGDGVYGLRRALVLAGAESELMSLWSVSDRSARDLIVGYYRNLAENQGRSEALRSVQLQLLSDKVARHPYYWASFIQSGEWAPLDAKR